MNSKHELDKIAVMKDGILYCRTRMLEGQTLRSVNDLADTLDLKLLTGVDFNVPLLHRNSPLAMSVALHLHYAVYNPKVKETIYRFSLQRVRILKGRSLFSEISEDCTMCKRLRKKYIEARMGPL